MTRVVVTGMGMVSPLGVGLSHNWKQLIANKSGLISTTTLPDYESAGWDKIPSKVMVKYPMGLSWRVIGKLEIIYLQVKHEEWLHLVIMP